MADSFWIQIRPFIVKIISPPQDRTGLSQLAHVIYSVFGLVGVTILVVAAGGLVIGSVLFWIRKRSA
ncbi:MAG TPA: hypothetical protein VGY57_12190 [Vicinamibacterales bacterium]|jgi:hypothetical protein|nr:hypothetical protein [Vicinamibacterales bacterium]